MAIKGGSRSGEGGAPTHTRGAWRETHTDPHTQHSHRLSHPHTLGCHGGRHVCGGEPLQHVQVTSQGGGGGGGSEWKLISRVTFSTLNMFKGFWKVRQYRVWPESLRGT